MAPTSLLQNTTLDRTRLSSWSRHSRVHCARWTWSTALIQQLRWSPARPSSLLGTESVMLFGCGSVSLKPCQAHRRTQSLILGRGRVSIQECYGRNETY